MLFPTNFVNKDFADRNFSDDNLIEGTNQNDLIVADFGDNIIRGLLGNDEIYSSIGNDQIYGNGGNDRLIGSLGNDLLDGGSEIIGGQDTADYSGLTTAITLEAVGVVNKGINGQDIIVNIERIIGAVDQENTIDGSAGASILTSFNVNLEQEKLTVKSIPTLGDVNFIVENFVNIIGTSQDDTIQGDSNNNTLEGGEDADLLIVGGDGQVFFTQSGDFEICSLPALFFYCKQRKNEEIIDWWIWDNMKNQNFVN